MKIPALIHQTWRDLNIPEKWRPFQNRWRSIHPKWEYRFWSDLDLRHLISNHYSWFLPIYDGYPEPIQRVDAARYFLMHRFGGVYADLDYECFRPFDDLLAGRDLVVGLEPEDHLSKTVVKEHHLDRVVGNAFLASCPSHPFWEHLFLRLVGSHRLPGPLTSTGPIFLTRTLENFDSSRPGASIDCLSSEVLYPGTSEQAQSGLLAKPKWREKTSRTAYGLHHWTGSWFIEKSAADTIAVPFVLTDRGKVILNGRVPSISSRAPDLVSCLMVTRASRLPFAKRSIACFQAQTYPSIELVIVDDDEGNELQEHVAELQDRRIRYVHLKNTNQALGQLRNIAVTEATGEYVIQWDDDDLYHPGRIESQMNALTATGADACFLSRWRIWWPESQRLAISKRRGWEGSILCKKEKLPTYNPTLKRGEDTPVTLRLASRHRIVFLDAPWLYTYVVHGKNTTPGEHLNEQWAQATKFYWDEQYADAIRGVRSEFPEFVKALIIPPEEQQKIKSKGAILQSTPFSIRSRVSDGREKPQKILILTPVKNGMRFMNSYFKGLERLTYPHQRISLGLLESDSTDGTYEELARRVGTCRTLFSRVELFKQDYQFNFEGVRSDAKLQLLRRSILAKSRNYLLSRSLRDEDAVLWLDFDIIEYPEDLIEQLLAKQKDILVPHCVLAPGGRTFDLNTFVKNSRDVEEVSSSEDPLIQPQRGSGRTYLEDLRDSELVEVDAVGGTALLIKANLHREGLIFPVAPYKKYIETEGLSVLARDMGVSSWGAPRIEVIHANH